MYVKCKIATCGAAQAMGAVVPFLARWKNNGALMTLPSPPVWKALSMFEIICALLVLLCSELLCCLLV